MSVYTSDSRRVPSIPVFQRTHTGTEGMWRDAAWIGMRAMASAIDIISCLSHRLRLVVAAGTSSARSKRFLVGYSSMHGADAIGIGISTQHEALCRAVARASIYTAFTPPRAYKRSASCWRTDEAMAGNNASETSLPADSRPVRLRPWPDAKPLNSRQ